jgi:hypothetical protein
MRYTHTYISECPAEYTWPTQRTLPHRTPCFTPKGPPSRIHMQTPRLPSILCHPALPEAIPIYRTNRHRLQRLGHLIRVQEQRRARRARGRMWCSVSRCRGACSFVRHGYGRAASDFCVAMASLSSSVGVGVRI